MPPPRALAEAHAPSPRPPFLPTRARTRACGQRPRRAAVAIRQVATTTWRPCDATDAPWSATRSPLPLPPLPPLSFATLGPLSHPFSRSQQQQAAPSSAIAAGAQSFSSLLLRHSPLNLRPPATSPCLPAPRARAQSRLVRPARPRELTGVSRNSSELSAHMVLSPILHHWPRF